MAAEFQRHSYLEESAALSSFERDLFARLAQGRAAAGEVSQSPLTLSRLLTKHHKSRTVILIDEYNAPIMAAYTHGYYSEAVDFLKSWLTGALKGNDSLAFACLTGVQRISKESIFSDLNNLTVNTSMSVAPDERYGFTQKEIEALAEYLGHTEGVKEAKRWYDGYRFGAIDVYNPWSVLNYFRDHCTADVYWGNTSSNSVLATLLEQADEHTTEQLFALMQPGGAIEAPLDLSAVFPDIGTREEVLWSMLYLAGYLTTNDVELPNNKRLPRTLRIPNREIAELYRTEITERCRAMHPSWKKSCPPSFCAAQAIAISTARTAIICSCWDCLWASKATKIPYRTARPAKAASTSCLRPAPKANAPSSWSSSELRASNLQRNRSRH